MYAEILEDEVDALAREVMRLRLMVHRVSQVLHWEEAECSKEYLPKSNAAGKNNLINAIQENQAKSRREEKTRSIVKKQQNEHQIQCECARKENNNDTINENLLELVKHLSQEIEQLKHHRHKHRKAHHRKSHKTLHRMENKQYDLIVAKETEKVEVANNSNNNNNMFDSQQHCTYQESSNINVNSDSNHQNSANISSNNNNNSSNSSSNVVSNESTNICINVLDHTSTPIHSELTEHTSSLKVIPLTNTQSLNATKLSRSKNTITPSANAPKQDIEPNSQRIEQASSALSNVKEQRKINNKTIMNAKVTEVNNDTHKSVQSLQPLQTKNVIANTSNSFANEHLNREDANVANELSNVQNEMNMNSSDVDSVKLEESDESSNVSLNTANKYNAAAAAAVNTINSNTTIICNNDNSNNDKNNSSDSVSPIVRALRAQAHKEKQMSKMHKTTLDTSEDETDVIVSESKISKSSVTSNTNNMHNNNYSKLYKNNVSFQNAQLPHKVKVCKANSTHESDMSSSSASLNKDNDKNNNCENKVHMEKIESILESEPKLERNGAKLIEKQTIEESKTSEADNELLTKQHTFEPNQMVASMRDNVTTSRSTLNRIGNRAAQIDQTILDRLRLQISQSSSSSSNSSSNNSSSSSDEIDKSGTCAGNVQNKHNSNKNYLASNIKERKGKNLMHNKRHSKEVEHTNVNKLKELESSESSSQSSEYQEEEEEEEETSSSDKSETELIDNYTSAKGHQNVKATITTSTDVVSNIKQMEAQRKENVYQPMTLATAKELYGSALDSIQNTPTLVASDFGSMALEKESKSNFNTPAAENLTSLQSKTLQSSFGGYDYNLGLDSSRSFFTPSV